MVSSVGPLGRGLTWAKGLGVSIVQGRLLDSLSHDGKPPLVLEGLALGALACPSGQWGQWGGEARGSAAQSRSTCWSQGSHWLDWPQPWAPGVGDRQAF